MATSKTLSPTNVTVSIPAMSDTPDASVFSATASATVDAVNALHTSKANRAYVTSASSAQEHILTIPSGFKGEVTILGGSVARQAQLIVDIASTGSITFTTVFAGTGLTISSPGNNQIKFAASANFTIYVGMIAFSTTDLSSVSVT